jgi:L-aspartate oxidase
MRFMQFHPTALQVPGKQEGLFLITEALRGFGAHMVNAEGKRFLFKSDMRGELATRDVLTAAIRSELRLSVGKQVYLDCRHLDPALLRLHFPSVCTALDQLKIDLSRHLIPVVPAAHYQCGGIVSGLKGETAMRHLYAAGECAYTGLHGRNRLASNSLLEALVFANRAATDVLERIGDAGLSTVSFAETRSHNPPDMETLYLLKDLASQLRQWVDLAGVPCQESPALNFEIPDRIAAITAELLNAGFLSREILQMRNMAAVARAIASDVQKHEQNHVDLASV